MCSSPSDILKLVFVSSYVGPTHLSRLLLLVLYACVVTLILTCAGCSRSSINNAYQTLLRGAELRCRTRHSLHRHWCATGALTADSHMLTKVWAPSSSLNLSLSFCLLS